MTRLSRTPAWLALAGLAVAALAGTQIGSAAALEVRVAAPLQVIEVDVDVDIPDPAPTEHVITVLVRRFTGSEKNAREVSGNSPIEAEFAVADGHTYTISWSEGLTGACSTLGHPIPPDHLDTIDGAFTAAGDVTHEVCTQTGSGTIAWTTTAPTSTD